ncbi:phage major capsid protein [Ensifer canadensis]|uniref:phage major capsid protein n=1 Tax=Ensifer canadensis TaxID=555315 RepID=UPI0035E3E56B
MPLKDLNEKRNKLVHHAREALDAITANTDEARAAELDARHDTIMAEFDKIEKQIDREERTAAIEARFEQRRQERRPISGDGEQRGQDDGDKPEYRHVFAKVVCGGIDDLSPEERAVLKQGVAKFEQRTQTAGTTTAGGYTVPTELANEIVRSMLAWGPMYDSDVARIITSSAGNPMKVPTVNDTGKSAGAHTEGTALTDDGSEDVTFGQKSLDAYVFDTEFIRWSFELDADSIFSMEALLADLLGERLGRVANAQLTNGTGTSAPNGVVTASSLGVTAASATALTTDELIDLEHSVNRAYRKSPKTAFMMNDLTVKAVRKLKNSDGDYVWAAGDITQGRPATLLGYKLHVNDSMADIATGNKTVLFGDFNKYFVRKVGAPVLGVLRERFWPDLGIAGLIRFDGELADQAAIKHLKQA